MEKLNAYNNLKFIWGFYGTRSIYDWITKMPLQVKRGWGLKLWPLPLTEFWFSRPVCSSKIEGRVLTNQRMFQLLKGFGSHGVWNWLLGCLFSILLINMLSIFCKVFCLAGASKLKRTKLPFIPNRLTFLQQTILAFGIEPASSSNLSSVVHATIKPWIWESDFSLLGLCTRGCLT